MLFAQSDCTRTSSWKSCSIILFHASTQSICLSGRNWYGFSTTAILAIMIVSFFAVAQRLKNCDSSLTNKDDDVFLILKQCFDAAVSISFLYLLNVARKESHDSKETRIVFNQHSFPWFCKPFGNITLINEQDVISKCWNWYIVWTVNWLFAINTAVPLFLRWRNECYYGTILCGVIQRMIEGVDTLFDLHSRIFDGHPAKIRILCTMCCVYSIIST